MIELNGPENAGEYGSDVPEIAKQRPHASPGPTPGIAPNASWFTAAVNPPAATPHAIIHDQHIAKLRRWITTVPGAPHPLYMVKDADPDGS
jgi:hypothetical protein